ncbi:MULTISPECIES: heavy metal response regulator transcription factor [unclassified Acinetobacter]|uniref:heavy metal response regulator transcription factor n=1 Tax=unclassified Acinetobacter TaxID=196816 RepID=UPI00293453B3|nr:MULTISPECIES: heavy metal response regulator transcription factor [unclassified Acinetobacter]WOE33084.1 heavy metal response regulator transcription factor [Acinetobacter sp. SAAs470]WOE39912.1 heavy metal response regulator transcription factor [Acinetobacter sp. SAAs474]
MCILIIEDEVKIASYLAKGLSESGYTADYVHSGQEGLERLKTHSYDLVILDVMLPDLDGWSVLKILRQFSKVPVIFLTAKDQISDRVQGLELGADDYLAKPFSYIELLARIKSLLRRQQYLQENQLHIGDLHMDLTQHKVIRDYQVIDLSKKEFALLHFLLRHQNEIVTRQQIASEVWHINFDTDTNFIDVAVRRLRSKIDEGHALKLIHTIRGLGYKVSVHP